MLFLLGLHFRDTSLLKSTVFINNLDVGVECTGALTPSRGLHARVGTPLHSKGSRKRRPGKEKIGLTLYLAINSSFMEC